MYSEEQLRRLAAWLPVEGWGEVQADESARNLVKFIEPAVDLGAFWHQADYENYTAVFAYRRADVDRIKDPTGASTVSYPAVLVWISHLAPVLAFGRSGWSQSLDRQGRQWARGYGGLDLDTLMAIEGLPAGNLWETMTRGLQQTGCAVLSPAHLREPAPLWFEPDERSEGVRPWDRIFHLLFQTGA